MADKESSIFERTRVAAALFTLPLLLYLILPLIINVPEAIGHVLLTLTAATAVHLLDRIWLFKDTLESLKRLTSPLAEHVASQTHALTAASASLDAMSRSGIVRLYASREEASNDIGADLLHARNTTVRLLGVSLNDFVRRQAGPLGRAWSRLEEFIRGERQLGAPNGHLTIKALIIDPECLGAQLRSMGESRKARAMGTRLKDEVMAVAGELLRLQETRTSPHVTLQCRLYRLPPALFLCHTDDVCYVQQYHFWTERKSDSDTKIPIVKYARQSSGGGHYPMHDEMEQHFEWIWDNASIPVENYLRHAEIGIDKGAGQSGMAAVYLDHAISKTRILSLLRSAKQRVTIQGISLGSFFSPGELFQAIAALVDVDRATVDVQVLVLDPDSEQAKLRAYREQLFAEPGLSFEDYCQSITAHRESTLYRDTLRTTKDMSHWLSTLIAQRRRKTPDWLPHIGVRKYASAPACFVLRVDDVVLVEQYHYGKDIPSDAVVSGTPVILGKDMPLIEYRRNASKLYGPVLHRSPFALIVDHLDFVFQHSAIIVQSASEAQAAQKSVVRSEVATGGPSMLHPD